MNSGWFDAFAIPELIVEEHSEAKTVSDDRRTVFMKLASDLKQISFEYPIEANQSFILPILERLKIFDDPIYKPFSLAILQGLEIFGEVWQPESVAAIVFARENSVSIAKAINNIKKANLTHSLSGENEATLASMFLFTLCEIGKEAEQVASAIKRYNFKSSNGMSYEYWIASRLNDEDANKLIDLYLKLKNAGVELTDDICSFVVFSTDPRSLIVDSLIKLRVAGILTNDLLKTMSVHQQQENLRPISNLLLYLNTNGITLTSEFINLAIQNGYFANATLEEVTKLICLGIKPSIEVVAIILQSEGGAHVEHLRQLRDHHLLPNALLISPPQEEKKSVLTSHSVVRVIECKKFKMACAAFVKHREEIDFHNDYLIQCILLHIENIDSVFKFFLSLQEHNISAEKYINDILLAYRTNFEDETIAKLIEKQRVKDSAEIKQNLQSHLPTPLIDCVLSFFHASTVRDQTCKIEQRNDADHLNPGGKKQC